MNKIMKKLALAMTLGAGALMATGANAAGVNISKLRINLTEAKPADFFTLTNSEEQKASFETTVFKWTQKDGFIKDGTMVAPETVLEETENILISPQTVVLMPKSDRVIRLIAEDTELATEDAAYRLRLQQLNTKEGFSTGTNVNILFNISLPIFFNSDEDKKAKDMNIETSFGQYDKKVTDENGKVLKTEKTNYIKIKNADTQHIQVLGIIDGEKTYDLSGYILPKITSYFDIPAEAASLKTMTISTDRGNFVVNK